ncbi:hypothetical protein JM83_2860 [Gillisia sp. Hel_I_86]|uniref:hypothetical protein n=1 Tax=Gillisia sp. Hel_I_86 TaxID=1249981 RepID=UPI00119ABB08|nr:hypothetical protein [Gillisia sp. Hel_I_86]TVZ27798.1 hypothetical protein JM83_2860 [Gillisia sp. Hel_I_86]
MNFIQRLGFFSVGLIMGIGILMFFLGGKKASCDYSPNARTLKNIRNKERVFSETVLTYFANHKLDTAVVSTILKSGNVDFGKSDTKKEPCKVYFISEELEMGEFELEIENCLEKAVIKSVQRVK